MTASIVCPCCGRTSYNPHDVREGYCGFCHDWTSTVVSDEEYARQKSDGGWLLSDQAVADVLEKSNDGPSRG
jgi:hypothetical protein